MSLSKRGSCFVRRRLITWERGGGESGEGAKGEEGRAKGEEGRAKGERKRSGGGEGEGEGGSGGGGSRRVAVAQ